MESTTGKFQWKYVISWLTMGAVASLIFVTSVKMPQGVNGFEVFFGMSLLPPIYGFFGILFDGWLRHERRFGEIVHSPLVWHIYPVIGLADIVFSITLGFLIAVVTSPFRSK